jgi:DNA-binding IclR family transcriptional regulator
MRRYATPIAEKVPSASGYRPRNSTADRTLRVLDLFSEEKLVIGGSEVARALSISRSSAYRYLQSLVASSFLEERPGGGFKLGPRVLELARLARRGHEVVELARPLMERLRDQVGETVLLTGRSGNRVICLDLEEAQTTVRISYERGSVLPLHAGASALVLLAGLPHEDARAMLSSQPLQRFTSATITDVDVLMDRLRAIRRHGFSVTRGELDVDVVGIAIPICSPDGSVAAALSAAAIERRMPADRVQTVLNSLRVTVTEIERRLEQAAD